MIGDLALVLSYGIFDNRLLACAARFQRFTKQELQSVTCDRRRSFESLSTNSTKEVMTELTTMPYATRSCLYSESA